jgi:hypothetical protein
MSCSKATGTVNQHYSAEYHAHTGRGAECRVLKGVYRAARLQLLKPFHLSFYSQVTFFGVDTSYAPVSSESVGETQKMDAHVFVVHSYASSFISWQSRFVTSGHLLFTTNISIKLQLQGTNRHDELSTFLIRLYLCVALRYSGKQVRFQSLPP